MHMWSLNVLRKHVEHCPACGCDTRNESINATRGEVCARVGSGVIAPAVTGEKITSQWASSVTSGDGFEIG